MKNYEQKYKEALEQAKKELEVSVLSSGSLDCATVRVLFKLFPELQKSEDELIREEILNCFVEMKKQGCFPSKHEAQYDSWVSWLEKQDEQKPICKFKVGDWVVQNGVGIYKIIEVCEFWYEVISYNDGMQYSIGFDEEDDCHLWTIYDAKDGDILVNKDGCIFIYNPNTSNYLTIRSYCYLSIQGNFLLENYNTGSWLYVDEVTPATKEQQDFLFQKIHEAGYKWNADSKRLNWICD